MHGGRRAALAAMAMSAALAAAGCARTPDTAQQSTPPATSLTAGAPAPEKSAPASPYTPGSPSSGPVAPTTVAIAPAPPRPVAPPPIEDPGKLVGMDRAAVEGLLGQPWLLRHEASAELWQYRAQNCVLDVFLYLQADGNVRVTYAELRSRHENRPPAAGCYGEIRDGARSRPQSARG